MKKWLVLIMAIVTACTGPTDSPTPDPDTYHLSDWKETLDTLRDAGACGTPGFQGLWDNTLAGHSDDELIEYFVRAQADAGCDMF